MDIPISVLWGIASGLLGAGAAWGGLLMRNRATAHRLEDVKQEHDADIAGIKAALQDLAMLHTTHRVETTDRLARIEEKLDAVLQQGRRS